MDKYEAVAKFAEAKTLYAEAESAAREAQTYLEQCRRAYSDAHGELRTMIKTSSVVYRGKIYVASDGGQVLERPLE